MKKLDTLREVLDRLNFNYEAGRLFLPAQGVKADLESTHRETELTDEVLDTFSFFWALDDNSVYTVASFAESLATADERLLIPVTAKKLAVDQIEIDASYLPAPFSTAVGSLLNRLSLFYFEDTTTFSKSVHVLGMHEFMIFMAALSKEEVIDLLIAEALGFLFGHAGLMSYSDATQVIKDYATLIGENK